MFVPFAGSLAAAEAIEQEGKKQKLSCGEKVRRFHLPHQRLLLPRPDLTGCFS